MKLTSMLLALTGFAVLTGCDTPGMLSLERVATAQETAIDPALLGTWADPSDLKTHCVVRQDADGGYRIAYSDENSTTVFQAQLFRVGNAEFLDMVTSSDDPFRIPGHVLARVWPEGTTLRWAFLDSDWLKQQAASLASHTDDKRMLLLASPAAVRAFIEAQGASDKAYGEVASWQKL